MKYKCYLCGDTIEVEEQVDIDYYNRFKSPICFKCYIKVIDVIKDGQFDEALRHTSAKISAAYGKDPSQRCKDYDDKYCTYCKQDERYSCFRRK